MPNKELLEKAVIKAREKLLSSSMNEAQISQGPVRAILQALGWDTFDVDSVIPEYTVATLIACLTSARNQSS